MPEEIPFLDTEFLILDKYQHISLSFNAALLTPRALCLAPSAFPQLSIIKL